MSQTRHQILNEIAQANDMKKLALQHEHHQETAEGQHEALRAARALTQV